MDFGRLKSVVARIEHRRKISIQTYPASRMAMILSLQRSGLIRSARPTVTSISSAGRNLHRSTAAQKKAKAAVNEDLFEGQADEDDLFGSIASSKSGQSEVSSPPPVSHNAPSERVLDPQRVHRFEEERQTTLYRCASDKDRSRPLPRRNAVRNALVWTDNGEQLEAAAELVAAMRRAGIPMPAETSRDFIGRCVSLRRPDVALKVLTQRNKYGIDIDLKSARDLLHTIFVKAVQPTPADVALDAQSKPFTGTHREDALLLTALYPHFRLIRSSQDPISSAILLSLFTHQSSVASATHEQRTQADTYRGYAKTMAADFRQMVQKKEVHVVNPHDDPHRQRVWVRSELQRKAVRQLLRLKPSTLTSIGVVLPSVA